MKHSCKLNVALHYCCLHVKALLRYCRLQSSTCSWRILDSIHLHWGTCLLPLNERGWMGVNYSISVHVRSMYTVTNTPFTLHFRTMPGQRTVLAQIHCEHASTHSHYSCVTILVLPSWLILSRCATHTQILQSRVAMVGSQLLLSFAEACVRERLRRHQNAVQRRCLFFWPARYRCRTRCGVCITHHTHL